MLQLILPEKSIRFEAFQKLKAFLANPGKFSLLVIGGRGAGKQFSIKKAFQEIKGEKINLKELCLKDLYFIDAHGFPSSESEIDKLFQNHIDQTLVIQDVEELSETQQRLIFDALSTEDGNFGISQKINIRLAFTSSYDVDLLRQEGEVLLGAFWDRISQLIVELPGFHLEQEYLPIYFKATWEKMKFYQISEHGDLATLPSENSLISFLESNHEKFSGGFRDLDKIAIMYFNYRLFLYNANSNINPLIEKEIVKKVKEDFFGKSQLHSDSSKSKSIFEIKPGFTMKELNSQFRFSVRNWAVSQYKTVQNAEKILGLKPGTMKNYREGKTATKEKMNENSTSRSD